MLISFKDPDILLQFMNRGIFILCENQLVNSDYSDKYMRRRNGIIRPDSHIADQIIIWTVADFSLIWPDKIIFNGSTVNAL